MIHFILQTVISFHVSSGFSYWRLSKKSNKYVIRSGILFVHTVWSSQFMEIMLIKIVCIHQYSGCTQHYRGQVFWWIDRKQSPAFTFYFTFSPLFWFYATLTVTVCVSVSPLIIKRVFSSSCFLSSGPGKKKKQTAAAATGWDVSLVFSVQPWGERESQHNKHRITTRHRSLQFSLGIW